MHGSNTVLTRTVGEHPVVLPPSISTPCEEFPYQAVLDFT